MNKFYTSPHGLLAKVKVLDVKTGLCLESQIYPEEVTTENFGTCSKTSMTFSPIVVPDPKYWNAEWDNRGRRPNPRREWKNVTIKKIIFSGPCTIILWDDGTKTMARVSEGDEFDPEKGVAVCFMKKIMGHTKTNKLLRIAHDQYWDEQDEKGNVIDQIKELMKGREEEKDGIHEA